MSDQERKSLVATITQLQQHQQVLAKYMAGIKRRLDDLTEQFHNRPEIQQISSLQDSLDQLHRQLDERSAPPEAPVDVANLQTEVVACVDEIQQQPIQVQSSDYQLVFDRSGSRAVLMEALDKAQDRLIIVSPWLNRNSIDADLLQKFKDCLNRNCCIHIGWGHLSDAAGGGLPVRDRGRLGKGWRYNALKDLRQLERDYPEFFRLKLLGTHEKFLVCDSTFAMLGSHNLLTSSAQSAEREVGIRTTDLHIIQGLINRFDGAEVQDAQAINESLTAGSVSLDDTEALDAQDTGDESNAVLANPDDGETEQDIDDSAEDSQEPAIDAEEFLRRYNNKETDFTGINLARVDLTGKSLGSDNLNLSKANLTRAKLGKAKLDCVNLSCANLRGAELCEAQLHQTNLSEANLENADLRKVNLYGTKLGKANLSNANLSGVNLSLQVDLNEANYSRANLSKANLRKAKLTKVDLRNANLSNANLLEANLEGANLQRVKLQQALYNASTVFPIGFDPVKSGAYLIAPNASLQKANLAGADLSGVNLTGADLQGANINLTNLSSADLSEANLSGTNITKANLQIATLLQANMSAANLSEANFSSANLTAANLVGANLIQANLKGTNLTAADLSKANLKNTNLYRANFSGAILTGVNLVGVDLQGVNLSGADLREANLCGAILSGANLSRANFTSADLRGANLENANLEKANLKEANLSGANLKQAKVSGAIMPDDKIHE